VDLVKKIDGIIRVW